MYPYHNRSNQKPQSESTMQVKAEEVSASNIPYPKPMPEPHKDHYPRPMPEPYKDHHPRPMPEPHKDHHPRPMPEPHKDHHPRPMPEPHKEHHHYPDPIHEPATGRKPTKAPPEIIPLRERLMRIDPLAISNCMFSYTYIWMKNDREFWFFPVYLGKTSIAGYRWIRGGWSYVGFDLQSIEYFRCHGNV